MKSIIILILLILFNISNSLSDNQNCKKLNKFSIEYLKCKGKLVKDKTITAGENIIKDTKEFQDKEWTKEKEKINNAKDKINKTKEKVLN